MSDESLHQDSDGCITLYKGFVKHSSAYNIQSLGISASSTNHFSGNKSITFAPPKGHYDSNKWYALDNSDKEKVLKERRGINVGNTYTKSGGHSNSGRGINNGQGEWKSNIEMLEKKSGIIRGSCQYSILQLSLVWTMKSQMSQTSKMGKGSIML